MKKCSKCEGIKPLDEFYNYAKSKDKKQSFCKVCCKVADKANRIKRQQRPAFRHPTAKVCRACHQTKPISQFGKNSSSLDKHLEYCKPCWTKYVIRAKRKQNVV